MNLLAEINAREIHHFRLGVGMFRHMPRPKIYDETRVTTAIRLPESLHERLRSAADEREVSVNYLVVRALDDYLSRLLPVDVAVRATA